MGTFILVFLFTCSVYLKSSAKLFNPCALGEDGEEMVCKFCTVNQKSSEALKKSLTLRYPPPSACTQAAGQSKQSVLCSCVLSAAGPCISPLLLCLTGGRGARGQGRDCHLCHSNEGKEQESPRGAGKSSNGKKYQLFIQCIFPTLRKLGKGRRLTHLPV